MSSSTALASCVPVFQLLVDVIQLNDRTRTDFSTIQLLVRGLTRYIDSETLLVDFSNDDVTLAAAIMTECAGQYSREAGVYQAGEPVHITIILKTIVSHILALQEVSCERSIQQTVVELSEKLRRASV